MIIQSCFFYLKPQLIFLLSKESFVCLFVQWNPLFWLTVGTLIYLRWYLRLFFLINFQYTLSCYKKEFYHCQMILKKKKEQSFLMNVINSFREDIPFFFKTLVQIKQDHYYKHTVYFYIVPLLWGRHNIVIFTWYLRFQQQKKKKN